MEDMGNYGYTLFRTIPCESLLNASSVKTSIRISTIGRGLGCPFRARTSNISVEQMPTLEAYFKIWQRVISVCPFSQREIRLELTLRIPERYSLE